MPSLCSQVKTEYQQLPRLKEQFLEAYKEAIKTKNLFDVKKSEAEYTESYEFLDSRVFVPIERAKEIMGKDFLGPDVIKKVLGIEVKAPEILRIREEELVRAKELGQVLVLGVEQTNDGRLLTMETIIELLEKDFKDKAHGGIIDIDFSVDHCDKEPYFKEPVMRRRDAPVPDDLVPRPGWALFTKDCIPDSSGKNYLQQTEMIEEYLKNKVYEGAEIPEKYRVAIEEFHSQNDELSKLLKGGDPSIFEPKMSKLKLNKISRPSPVEVLYYLLIYYLNNDERLLENEMALTRTADSDGVRVSIGNFNHSGIEINGVSDHTSGRPGVVFTRMITNE